MIIVLRLNLAQLYKNYSQGVKLDLLKQKELKLRNPECFAATD